MTLNKKMLLIFLLAFSIFASLNYGLHHYLILPGLKKLEIAEAKKDMGRCLWELKDEIDHVDRYCHDLAAWDDLHAFIKAPNADFLKINLNADTILDNEVSFICIVDRSGQLLFAEDWDLHRKEKTVLTTLPDSLRSVASLPFSSESDKDDLSNMKRVGIYNSSRGPMMLSSRPIITSNQQGPVQGAVIIGRLLDQGSLDAMMVRVALNFRFIDMSGDELTAKEKKILGELAVEEISIVERENSDNLEVYSHLADIGGRYLIQAEIPKHILQRCRKNYNYSLILITVFGLFMALLITYLLKAIILAPVMLLTNHVLQITKSGDLSARISLLQNDEIGTLAREENRMLMQLESQRREITEAKDTLNAIIENSQVGVMALRGEQIMYKGNQRLADIFAYNSPESMEGRSAREFHLSEENYIEFREKYFKKLVDGNQIQVEYKLRRKDGSSVWCTLSGKAIDSSTPPDLEKGVVWTIDDITTKRQSREKLQRLATTDSLTGLCNRSQLFEIAEAELERQRHSSEHNLSLVMLDIDYFKKINDAHGHAAGDLVLKAFADIGRKYLRDVDVFARIGGEEFIILLPGTDIKVALKIAERFRALVEKNPVMVNEKEIAFTVSFGVTAWNGIEQTFEEVLHEADSALYVAKEKGRNRVEMG
ncbi:diguanylate cyclase [Desulfotalea psychrophila]|uniref:diguanylate cyclase n=1 Tax=Desulfotalea psychrophila (strain LSv54 / DSM 12343) TaxID=177439 RepID=Q6ALC0_DESPS|nr:diguanylate cyclase [Desulfotalea psychrophila]CAG36855.1 conserved hypothetical protein [Desulfotalea psychrophila LSv54]